MTNKIKTLLFASLIAAMILPFSGMQTAEAKADVSDIQKLTAYEEWVLDTLAEYPDSYKTQSIEELRAFVDTLDGYEAFIFDKVENIAESEKELKLAKDQDKPEKVIRALEMKRMALYFELEEYGLTTQDRFDANPDYWKAKVLESKIKMESADTTSVSLNDMNSDIYNVHQTDLALKRTSILTVPIFGYGGSTVPFPVITYGWNQGTSTSEWYFITALSGKVTYESIVCLDSNTHHDSVDFDMNSKGVIRTLFGSIFNQYSMDASPTFSNAGDCKTLTEKTTIGGTYSTSLSTTISDVSLN